MAAERTMHMHRVVPGARQYRFAITVQAPLGAIGVQKVWKVPQALPLLILVALLSERSGVNVLTWSLQLHVTG